VVLLRGLGPMQARTRPIAPLSDEAGAVLVVVLSFLSSTAAGYPERAAGIPTDSRPVSWASDGEQVCAESMWPVRCRPGQGCGLV